MTKAPKGAVEARIQSMREFDKYEKSGFSDLQLVDGPLVLFLATAFHNQKACIDMTMQEDIAEGIEIEFFNRHPTTYTGGTTHCVTSTCAPSASSACPGILATKLSGSTHPGVSSLSTRSVSLTTSYPKLYVKKSSGVSRNAA
jgi:hypothetical protein